MNSSSRRYVTAGAALAVAVTLGAAAAQATPLPVQNLTFSNYTGVAPKGYFGGNGFSNSSYYVNPVGWSRGPTVNDDLVFIDAPGTANQTGAGPNSYAVYPSGSSFPAAPPGGNFVQADGNPQYESTFYQAVSGLSVGTDYSLSFWQAAGQQQGFSGATTEQWVVFFGNTAPTVSCTTNPCTYSAAGDQIYASDLMNTPSQSYSPWELVSTDFTATAASETLYFLAWGDNGSTTNLPPTVFLAGVNSPSVLPEPATLSVLGIGLVGLGANRLRRRNKKTAV